MGRHVKPEPTYLYKEKNKGRIYWRGEFRDLPGQYKSKESWAAYYEYCAIVAMTGELPIALDVVKSTTIRELGRRYMSALKQKFGKSSKEPDYVSYAVKDVVKLFGGIPVTEFAPTHLKAMRTELIKQGKVRRTVNKRAQQITKMFRWAVEEGIADPDQWQRLKAVEAIQMGHYGAKDNPPIKPVPESVFEQTLEHISKEARDALLVMSLTGMRTGELLRMRPQDVDMTGRHWYYRTDIHKTGRKTGETIIAIPAPAVEILVARMPKTFSHRWWSRSDTWLRLAVKRICDRHEIPHWHPHQLRHRLATLVSDKIDQAAAQKLLRHADPRMTDHYVAQTKAGLDVILDKYFGTSE